MKQDGSISCGVIVVQSRLADQVAEVLFRVDYGALMRVEVLAGQSSNLQITGHTERVSGVSLCVCACVLSFFPAQPSEHHQPRH